MSKKIPKEHQVPKLGVGETFDISNEVEKLRLTVEWISIHGLICDLDLGVLIYDERARFVEKLSVDSPTSVDGSTTLEGDIDSIMNENAHKEFSTVNLSLVDKVVSAILFFVDGGPRNFQFVQTVIMNCDALNGVDEGSFFNTSTNSKAVAPLFDIQARTKRDCQGVALSVLFRKFKSDGTSTWAMKNLLEHVYVGTLREKDDKCGQIIIQNVPSLEKYRPRLFQSIKAICSTLSSKSLPLLKDKFEGAGLPLTQFVETLFKQLFEVCPRLSEQSEADYLVAMLHDMFGQIDLNGDGAVDWDEFTSFTVSTGVSSDNNDSQQDTLTGFSDTVTEGKSLSKTSQLDDYIIEYAEDAHFRDRSHFHGVQSVRHIPSARRIVVVPMHSDHAIVFNEEGKELCKFFPARAQASVIRDMDVKTGPHDHSSADPRSSLIVYDTVYLSGRDLYAYCASDHTIGICKEKNSFGGKRIRYDMYNKIIFSNLLHLKLCWSEGSKLLCSVASNNNIYGWDIDTGSQLFNVSRHSDVVTDFIALDNKELFVTCSLDKRIVLWSMTSRRVKGILVGHKRGIRVLSVANNTLLSAGFEAEAKTWDLSVKEVALTLKGHRFPITAAKIMCIHKGTDDDLRAVTADESGEIRLWNVCCKEKSSEAALAPVLQVFQMIDSQPPNNKFQDFVFPFSPNSTKGCYSNILAFSSKLVHFTPEKSAREFAPPATTVCNDSLGMCATAVGRSLLKYDLTSGQFITAFPNLSSSDLTALCFDNEKGRKLYVGCNNGDVLMINFSTGTILTQLPVHAKEVTALYSEPAVPGTSHVANIIVSGSLDGRLRVLEEVSGELNIHYTTDNPFLDNSPIGHIKGFSIVKLMVVASTSLVWTVWHVTQHKRLMILKEESPILDVVILTDPEFVETEERRQEAAANIELSEEPLPRDSKRLAGPVAPKENLLTVAIATLHGVNIYTLDVLENLAVRTFCLVHSTPIFITSLTQLHCSEDNIINYTAGRKTEEVIELGSFIVVTTDDGRIVCWKIDSLLTQSIAVYREHYPLLAENKGSTHLKSLESFLDNVKYGHSSGCMDLSRSNNASPRGLSRSVTQNNSSVNSPREHDEEAKMALLARSQTETEVQGLLSTQNLSSNISWEGHFEVATIVLPLHNDGCILTVGHDGFHRVWNMDAECLGEMMLTNLTEAMKAKTKMTGYSHSWKYVQERIPITSKHRMVARRLVRINLGLEEEKNLSKRRSNLVLDRYGSFSTKILPHHQDKSGLVSRPGTTSDNETAELRASKLVELCTPSVTESNNSFFQKPDPPSTSKSAKAGDSLKLPPTAGSTKLSKSPTSTVKNGFSSLFAEDSVAASVGEGSVFTSNLLMTPLKKRKAKQRPVTTMWSAAQAQKKAYSPSAFSEASIGLSHQTGLIDSEGHQLLRKMQRDKGKTKAYDRVVPELYMRSTTLSTGISVPKLEDVHVSETHFGPQKSLYKNAVNEYSSRFSSFASKVKTHHTVTTDRIKDRVKNLGTMIHLENKVQMDDVVVPTECYDDRAITEEVLRRLPSKLGFNKDTGMISSPASFGYIHQVGSVGSGGAAFTENSLKGIAMGRRGTISVVESFATKTDDDDDDPGFSTASSNYKKTSLQSLQENYFLSGSKSRSDVSPIKDPFSIKVASSSKDMDSDDEAATHYTNESKLNYNRIAKYMHKLDDALDLDNIPEWEKRSTARRLLLRHRKKLKSLEAAAHAKMVALEKRLAEAIKQVFRIVGANAVDRKNAVLKPLTTRALLPFYKLEDVDHFLDIFNKVDTDFSGDLDPEEWTNFFTAMNRSVTHQEAQVMFLKMDTNEDGVLSIRELVPMVFDKARKDQLRQILYYVESEVMRKRHKGKDNFTPIDLEALFDYYDSDVVGFVAISAIRERLQLMDLPADADDYFTQVMSGMEDDEMVNPVEFERIFSTFLAQPRKMSQGIR